jgi:HTH-type transcriptional regulator/antitoxin HigA
MSATLLDEPKYRKLLGKALPVVVRTDAEYRRLLQIVEQIMEKPEEDIGEEEGRLLELLGVLIENYEDRTHPPPITQPHKMLAHLMEEKGISASDLWPVLPKSRVSEIVSFR